MIMMEQRRASTNFRRHGNSASHKKIRQAVIVMELAANSHLPTVDIWEHFYIFSNDCATGVAPMQFMSRIDKISFNIQHYTPNKSWFR